MATGRFDKLILGAGLAATDNGDGTITIEVDAGAGGFVASDVIWDAKGDLAVGSAANTADNLGVGSDGDVLVADSGETLGVKWEAPSGATPAWTQLTDTTLGSDGTFDVSSISGSYNDLMLVCIARGSASAASDALQLRFNNDSGNNYYRQVVTGIGTSVAAALSSPSAFHRVGTITASTGQTNGYGVSEITIFGYASTAWIKNCQWRTYEMDGTGASAQTMNIGGGTWNSTSAIDRVTLFGNTASNLLTGSQLRIYGRL